MRTTLKQIAEATRLSVTIVSQVLNDKPCRISDEKRELILNTAREMNYRPNLVAVSLVKGATNTIGLAISDIRNEFFSVLAKGVEEECQKENWNVILCNSNDKHAKDMDNLRILADKGASGIIFGMAAETTAEMARECLHFLEQEQIPYFLIDRYVDSAYDKVVCLDHVRGGELAASYLLRMGHRSIACITGPMNLLDSQQRLEGVRKELNRCNVPMIPELIVEGKYTYESGGMAVERLLKRNIAIDAIFAFNDMMAIGAIQKLKEYGISVPEEISVVGYDDIFMARFLDIPLTTVKQPADEMGRVAARMIIDGYTGKKRKKAPIIFSPELIERKSVILRKG